MKMIFPFFLILFISCQNEKLTVQSLSGQTMGTTWSVKFVAKEDKKLSSVLEADLKQELLSVNQAMSTYIKESEINQFNRIEKGKKFRVSDQLFQVTMNAISISKKTNGAFDPTLGPVISLWGFSGERDKRVLLQKN